MTHLRPWERSERLRRPRRASATLLLACVALVALAGTAGAEWERQSKRLRWIATDTAADGWGVDASGVAWKRIGAEWIRRSGNLVQVSRGGAAGAWGVDAQNRVYEFVRPIDGYGYKDRWAKQPGGLTHVASGAHLWGIGPTGSVYQRVRGEWERRPGKLKQIAAARDGAVWGVTDENRIYEWNGSDWQRVDGALQNIAVGSRDHVWGVGPTGGVYQRVGGAWQRREGRLAQISVGSDGDAWGVTDQGRVYRWVTAETTRFRRFESTGALRDALKLRDTMKTRLAGFDIKACSGEHFGTPVGMRIEGGDLVFRVRSGLSPGECEWKSSCRYSEGGARILGLHFEASASGGACIVSQGGESKNPGAEFPPRGRGFLPGVFASGGNLIADYAPGASVTEFPRFTVKLSCAPEPTSASQIELRLTHVDAIAPAGATLASLVSDRGHDTCSR